MKVYGYLKKTESLVSMADANEMFGAVGCDVIIKDEVQHKITRPKLRSLINTITKGDTLIIYSFSNVVRCTEQVCFLLAQSQQKGFRIKSLKDKLDTAEVGNDAGWIRLFASLPMTINQNESINCTSANTFMLRFKADNKSALNTKVRDGKIIEAYTSGKSIIEISKLYSVGRSTIYRVLESHEVKRERHGSKESSTNNESIDVGD